MDTTLSELLALSGEPALLVRQGEIVFANALARGILGPCLGESAEKLLGAELFLTPARAYVAEARISGVTYILRVNRLNEGRLIFLRAQEEAPIVINDAFLYSLRSNLMTLGMAADRLRPAAEDLGLHDMLDDLTALTSGYFKLLRLSENASLVRDCFENRAAFTPVELDMSLLIHAVLDAVEETCRDRQFSRDIADSLRLCVDARLVRQLLFNLLSNCMLHSGASLIRVRLAETAESAILSVSDNGCGIPAEELSTVFERYRSREPGGGTGLGLSAARMVAALHGGTLLLESRIDQGTSVRASFSKKTQPGQFETGETLCTMREMLTGLADCLPLGCFDERYLD